MSVLQQLSDFVQQLIDIIEDALDVFDEEPIPFELSVPG